MTVTDGVSISSKAPETLGAVDVGVGDLAGVLGIVEVAEVVAAGGVVLQSHGEKRGVQFGFDSVKECLLRPRLDCTTISQYGW